MCERNFTLSQEQVRSSLTNFIARNTTRNISFEEWNGDKLATLIQVYFLREDLLPKNARANLRKSLAMLDEPVTSYKHFAALICSLSGIDALNDVERITAIRQIGICLWILFAWAREAKNMESAYLSSELSLLHAWKIVTFEVVQNKNVTQAVEAAFFSIFSAYQKICTEFLVTNVLPHVDKLHALSVAVQGSGALDVNLKLFDLLGRLGVDGLWQYWKSQRCPDEANEAREQMLNGAKMCASAIKALVSNNPALLLPIKDDQAIDISIAIFLLALDSDNWDDVKNWLSEILDRARFAYTGNGHYPCILHSYSELLTHPKRGDDEYRQSVTAGSILYPIIALWAALFDEDDIYGKVALFKKDHLKHCNFQLWYPDDRSEEHFYANSEAHGAVLSHLPVGRSKHEFLAQVFGECDQTPHFKELSAVKFGWWPLIVVACRHYQLPLALHLLEGLRQQFEHRIATDGGNQVTPDGSSTK